MDKKRNGIYGKLTKLELAIEKDPLFERFQQHLRKAVIWKSYEVWKNAWVKSWNLVHSDEKWNLWDEKDSRNIQINNLRTCYDVLIKKLVNYREDMH